MNKSHKLKFTAMLLTLFLVVSCLAGCATVKEILVDTFGSEISFGITVSSSIDETIEGHLYGVGDVLEANGLKLTFKKYEEWEQDNKFVGATQGKKIIRAYFIIENTSGSDKSVGSWDFACYADDFTADEYIYADDILEHTSLSVGDKLEGYVYFEVPSTAEDMIIEYKSNYWIGDRAIFKVTLAN